MYLEISRRKTKLCQNGETEPEIAPAFVTVTQKARECKPRIEVALAVTISKILVEFVRQYR